jgi:hypothetical protein
MNMKDEELKGLIDEYGLDKEEYLTTNEKGSTTVNRKKLNNVLKAIDMATGKVKETLLQEPGEATKEYEPSKGRLHKGLSGMMVQLTFYNSDENDLPYIQMALNGIALLVPREKKVWIPKEYIDGVLANAIITKMKMETTKEGKIRYVPKQVQRIQYTVHDMKHIDELKKEHDTTKE